MPTYTFLNKDTGEEHDEVMPYSKLDDFISDNPHLQQVFKMNIVDPVSVGVTRPPIDFQRHVLSKVKEIPGANKSAIEKRWVCPKEV